MGCDIHLYIEYRNKDSEKEYWYGFGDRINPGRDYIMFGLMSKGVRCEFPESFKPKGMPEVLGSSSRCDSQIYISETPNNEYCTLKKAWEWHESGASKIIFQNEKPTWVTNPDWHSHSWLSVEEFDKVIENYKKISKEQGYGSAIGAEWEAVAVLLRHFQSKGFESRIVFWFDN